MYKAIDIAKYAVSKSNKDGLPLSNLQLQKILFFIQKAYLEKDLQAFGDDIEAWQFGPVVPNVYYDFCGFGAMPISASYDDIEICPEDAAVFDAIIEEKRVLDPWDLVEQTHKRGGAWQQTYRPGGHQSISTDLIKKLG